MIKCFVINLDRRKDRLKRIKQHLNSNGLHFTRFQAVNALETNSETIYDLASLTKILVTTPIIMSLFDQKVIDLETKLKNIIPRYIESNKSDISIKELLSGHAGLQAWIPFYKMTLDEENKPSSKYYSFKRNKINSLKVAPDLFLRAD